MKHTMILILLGLVLAGCVTITYPDGTTETRIDVEMASLALDTAVAAYNIYVQTTAEPEQSQSRLGALLDDIERAESLYNRIAERLNKKAVISQDAKGLMEVQYHDG